MGKKKKGAEKGKAKKEKKLKQEKKKDKTEKKKQQKEKVFVEEEEEDIDAILAQFQKDQEAKLAITEEQCPPPSRRSCGVFAANPLNLNEIILFAGEYYDGQKVMLNNELFVYNVEKNDWRKIISPNTPAPRSSHQLCLTTSGRGFLFGGEFVSPNQTTFFHYKDFWSLDLKTYAWEKLEVGKKPSPRSGHRNLWTMKMSFEFDKLRWERRKKGGNAPQPRSGAPMVSFKNRGYMFGGVMDVKEDDETIESVCLDELFQLNLEQGKFYPVTLRKKPNNAAGPVVDPRPVARFNPMMCVQRSNLYIFGGIQEKGNQEITFSDMWSLDLDKLDTFKCLIEDPNATAAWLGDEEVSEEESDDGEDSDDSDEEDDDDDEDDDDEDDEDESDDESKKKGKSKSAKGKEVDVKDDGKAERTDQQAASTSTSSAGSVSAQSEVTITNATQETVPEQASASVVVSLDQPVELSAWDLNQPQATDASLRDYYARTSDYWMSEAIKEVELEQKINGGGASTTQTTGSKMLRRLAFELAEEAFEESIPKLAEQRRILKENEVKAEEAKRSRAENEQQGDRRARRT
ncbi:hypothetical protein HDU76_008433 [Blyttiomyces sp. JEL0837]|nr:hypothetical protein HDU76_008433 [Blyttiomyces sp. JEL0837]